MSLIVLPLFSPHRDHTHMSKAAKQLKERAKISSWGLQSKNQRAY